MRGTIRITIQDDGSLKTDGRLLEGDVADILAQLESLAADIGGDKSALTVEKHVHGPGHSHGAHDHGDHDHGEHTHTH